MDSKIYENDVLLRNFNKANDKLQADRRRFANEVVQQRKDFEVYRDMEKMKLKLEITKERREQAEKAREPSMRYDIIGVIFVLWTLILLQI